jgi:WD repeat-containing protein 35
MNGVGNIEDELTEHIKLRNVRIALIEWLPFDRNQLSALNIKLDSYHHRRGHIVTALQDDSPGEIVIHDDGISCKVIVEDFSPSEYIHFRAMLNFPEDEGILQKEELSGYINTWGRVIYGAELFEVEEAIDGWVSLDVLTRIIVDLTIDTSRMIDSLLTEYQRNLLNLIYLEEADKRTKFVVIFAEDINIRPSSPKDFFDGEELQNELEQILDVMQKADSFDDGYNFSGQYGEILVMKEFQKYEQSFLERGFSNAIKIFLDDYSAIIWHLWDESKRIEQDIDKAMLGDITSLTNAQNWITKASSEAIMLHDILAYLRDSITEFVNEITEQDPSRTLSDPLIKELARLQDDSLITTKRVNDTRKVIQGLESKMVALRDLSNALAERHMRRISDSMAQNTKSMMQMTESNNRASDALSIIELILAGSVIIEIVLMFFGEYAIPDLWPDALGISKYGGLIVIAITIVLWIGVFISLRISKKRLEISAVRRQRGSYVIGRRINVPNLEKYLHSQHILVYNVESESDTELITVTFELVNKKTKGIPEISSVIVVYDANEEFLIQIEFESPRMDCDLKECYNYLMNEFEKAGVFQLVLEGESC